MLTHVRSRRTAVDAASRSLLCSICNGEPATPYGPSTDVTAALKSHGQNLCCFLHVAGSSPSGKRGVIRPYRRDVITCEALQTGMRGESLAVVTESREVSGAGQEPFRQSEYVVDTSTGKGDGKQARWKVVVRADGHKIVRTVSSDPDQLAGDEMGWEPEGVIWPTWPNTSEDEVALTASPLAEVQEYWSAIGNRLRDSAKWMAAVLGAALAALVGSSPLAGLNSRHLQGIAITFGLVGLAFLGVTMLLVLRVMRPQSVSFTQVQSAQEGNWPFSNSLRTWRDLVESQEDLYLPCGVNSLTSLRQSMIIEEVTLQALARARGSAVDEAASSILCEAQTARAARLLELRTAGARIASIGEYYKLRTRSTWATYAGVLSGLIGTAAVVAAFAWPPR